MQLPKRILAASLILVLTMAGGSWVDLRIDQMHARHIEISTGLEKLVRLNQALSSMLMVSVLERNTLRSASYDSVNAELELTLRSVERLTRLLELPDEVATLDAQRTQLRQVEMQALALMRNDRWDQARGLLFADAYVLARKIYEIDSEAAIGALNSALAASAERFGTMREASLAIRGGALLLLLWAGASFSRRLGRELAEQARLRDEISATNQHLEDKVHERTLALEQANRRLEDLSATDGLTGLANRRRFDTVWESEWQRATRQALPLAVAMIDVDHFKAYNDHHGHQMGDECLRQVGQVLRTSAQRAGELAARYGGEEFVVILPGLPADEANDLGERIRRAVQALGIAQAPGVPPGVVTVSVGVAAHWPRPGDRAEALLQAADHALYQAKHQGRNRVVRADDGVAACVAR